LLRYGMGEMVGDGGDSLLYGIGEKVGDGVEEGNLAGNSS
jgi:hypothetical protein